VNETEKSKKLRAAVSMVHCQFCGAPAGYVSLPASVVETVRRALRMAIASHGDACVGEPCGRLDELRGALNALDTNAP